MFIIIIIITNEKLDASPNLSYIITFLRIVKNTKSQVSGKVQLEGEEVIKKTEKVYLLENINGLSKCKSCGGHPARSAYVNLLDLTLNYMQLNTIYVKIPICNFFFTFNAYTVYILLPITDKS